MRLHFTFELENENMPIDYRRKFVSYIKFCVENSDKDFYEELYGKGRTVSKDFVMSFYFIPETRISKEQIYVNSKKIILKISTPDSYLGIQIYNAICKQKLKWYKLSDINTIRLVKVYAEKERVITQKSVIFNAISPIVIRDHNKETGKDWFYTFEDEQAVDILKRNLKSDLEKKFDRNISYDIEQLKIEFLKMKKVVVQNYGLNIQCSLGTFKMEGESYLLQYLYQRGIGGKRSLGFGYLELL